MGDLAVVETVPPSAMVLKHLSAIRRIRQECSL